MSDWAKSETRQPAVYWPSHIGLGEPTGLGTRRALVSRKHLKHCRLLLEANAPINDSSESEDTGLRAKASCTLGSLGAESNVKTSPTKWRFVQFVCRRRSFIGQSILARRTGLHGTLNGLQADVIHAPAFQESVQLLLEGRANLEALPATG